VPNPAWREFLFIISTARANVDIVPIELPQPEFEAVIAFLSALTDQAGTKGRLGKPTLVPSGLAVD